jgi:hypothetical protein
MEFLAAFLREHRRQSFHSDWKMGPLFVFVQVATGRLKRDNVIARRCKPTKKPLTAYLWLLGGFLQLVVRMSQ